MTLLAAYPIAHPVAWLNPPHRMLRPACSEIWSQQLRARTDDDFLAVFNASSVEGGGLR